MQFLVDAILGAIAFLLGPLSGVADVLQRLTVHFPLVRGLLWEQLARGAAPAAAPAPSAADAAPFAAAAPEAAAPISSAAAPEPAAPIVAAAPFAAAAPEPAAPISSAAAPEPAAPIAAAPIPAAAAAAPEPAAPIAAAPEPAAPIAAAPLTPLKPDAHRCASCGRAPTTAKSLLRCSRCKAVAYCSRECQAAAFPGHKKACALRADLLGKLRRKSAEGSSAQASAVQRDELERTCTLFREAGCHAAELRGSLEADLGDFPTWWPITGTDGAAGTTQTASQGLPGLWACEAEMRRCLAASLLRLRQPADAQAAAAEARACALKAGDVTLQVDAMAVEATCQLNQGAFDEAQAIFVAALALCQDRRAADEDEERSPEGEGSDDGRFDRAECSLRSNYARLCVATDRMDEATSQMARAVDLRRVRFAAVTGAYGRAGMEGEDGSEWKGIPRIHAAAKELAGTLINHAGVLQAAAPDPKDGGERGVSAMALAATAAAKAAYEEALQLSREVSDLHLEQAALQGLVNLSGQAAWETAAHGGDGATRDDGAGEEETATGTSVSGGGEGHATALADVLRRTGRRVDGTCAICLEDIGDKESLLTTLPACAHIFHSKCISQWMASGSERAGSCPTCQGSMYRP